VIEKFKMAKNEESGDNWLICWTGQDAQGNHFNVTTNFIRASSLYNYTRGAEDDAKLIARLLNWYYADQNAAEQTLALDGGDSAASEQLSTPEVLSTLQGESTPAHRQ
jgi:hypothetical protein